MVRKANAEDLKRIEEIYEALFLQQDRGDAVIGWIRGVYPTGAAARKALHDGELFVLEREGRVAASAKINREQGAEYGQAAWKNQNVPESRVMVLHTLAVDPAFAGKGCGTEFIKYYEQYALMRNCPYLRMDTMSVNKAARRLYHHLGYEEADVVPCVFNGIPDVQLVCLEKTLPSGGRDR